MFSSKDHLSHYSRPNVIAWLAMAFQAGTINTGGFLACQSFVSHVTGFGTLIGAEGARGDFYHLTGVLLVPGFFMIGAMISAFFVDRRIQSDIRPHYPLVLFLIFLLTTLVTIGGNLGYLGKFGDPVSSFNDYLLIAALCLACGLQNATVTSAFGAVVRTTHLTGITTDLAIGLVRVVTDSHRLQTRNNEIRANWMRTGLIISFVLGSFLSAFIYIHAQYWGFLIPSSIATILFLWSTLNFIRHKSS